MVTAAMAIFFTFAIVYDTQLVVGGEHRSQRQLNPQDWALGVVVLRGPVPKCAALRLPR